MNLIDVYKSLLATAGMVANEDGFISMQLANTDKKPVIVKGKGLVLPLDIQLRNPDFSNRMVFHPLSESILRGESEVVTSFREALTKRLNFIIGYVSINLLDLAVSTAEHPKLSPDQTEFLTYVKETDDGTLQRLQKVTEAMMVGDSSRAFAHIRVQKNGTVGATKHRRVGIVYFPFYEEIIKTPAPKEANEIYGVKLRKSDRETFKALMEYLIPGIDNPAQWMFPSDSEIAPTIDALMKTVIAVGDLTNTTVDLFKDYIHGAEDLYFNGDWEPSFADLNSLLPQIRLIPMQPGNEGRIPPTNPNAIAVDERAPAISGAAPTKTAVQEDKPAEKVSIRPPVGGLSGIPLSATESTARTNQPQQHPLAPPQQPQPTWSQPTNYQNQQPSYPAPGYGAPAQPMAAQPLIPGSIVQVQTPQGLMPMFVQQNGQLTPVNVQPQQGYNQFQQPQQPLQNTGRGLSWNSVMANNPQLAANMPQQGYQQQGYGSHQQSNPAWSRPNYSV